MHRVRVCLLLACGVLAACSPTAQVSPPTPAAQAVPAPPAQPTMPAPTPPQPTASVPTSAPPPDAAPDVAAPPVVEGRVVVQIPPGSDAGQIGYDATSGAGAPSFRIGSDGSIRVLDARNRRLLFFTADGGFRSAFALPEAAEARDFIVTGAGDVYVYTLLDDNSAAVLRYTANGTLAETLPVDVGVSILTSGISLSAEQEGERGQELVLTQDLDAYWTLRHFGETVPPALQSLTRTAGTVTPRSPTPFASAPDARAQPQLSYTALTGGVVGTTPETILYGSAPLPDAQFFNVDQAMYPYFVRAAYGDTTTVDIWRTAPDATADTDLRLTVQGSGRIVLTACDMAGSSYQGSFWRRVYVDQQGKAWSMCVNETGATIRTYDLLDAAGQPVPTGEPLADVPWKPGAQFSAA